jgi:aerobic-type carbon monoxide dehydrogenase small subunit (CoxS/CutS family)
MPTYTVRINGRTHEVEGDADDTLLSVLRYDLDLTGSKFGCGEGACFLEAEAFQCGYCTPGMVMATVGLLRSNPAPSDADIARVMDRNVCRCGTYPRIVRAVKLAAEKMKVTSSEARR